jgi:hypothetical protein
LVKDDKRFKDEELPTKISGYSADRSGKPGTREDL